MFTDTSGSRKEECSRQPHALASLRSRPHARGPAPTTPRPQPHARSCTLRRRRNKRFCRVFSANDAYGIPVAAGGCGAYRKPCEQLVAVVTHFASLGTQAGTPKHEALPEVVTSAEGPATRPEIFVSGALHGDERVGPLATLWSMELMVHAAACVEKGEDAAHCSDLTAAERSSVLFGGPAAANARLKWLSRLVRRRTLYAMPMTNARGFSLSRRDENGIDPNRDFAIDTKSTACMRSVTARCVNELWRRHVFQLAITFHGGMEALAYEWGAPSHNKQHGLRGSSTDVSPDDNSQREATQLLSAVAGRFGRVGQYKLSRMNSIVYPVNGGMEDWAYAASWDTPLFVKGGCASKGYSTSRTATYPNATNRAFMLLVECSNAKSGYPLGTREALFDSRSVESGHVARNVRLMLAALDVVEPYIAWLATTLPEEEHGKACLSGDEERAVYAVAGEVFECEVGGSLAVTETWGWWGCWDQAARDRERCGGGRSLASSPNASALSSSIETTDAPRLPDRRSHRRAFGFPLAAAREACGGFAWAVAAAQVDDDWGAPPAGDHAPKSSPPQTHFANVRSNPGWRHAHNGQVVVGRKQWFSAALVVDLKSQRRRAPISIEKKRHIAGAGFLASAAAVPTHRHRRRSHDGGFHPTQTPEDHPQ